MPPKPILRAALVMAAVSTTACGGAEEPAPGPVGSGQPTAALVQDTLLPPSGDEARARLAASPRHGEWVVVPAGDADSVRAWVVYPERSDRAPVVVVVHEIFGLTHWIRAVADRLAADGFIAVAPDLLTGSGVPVGAEGEPEREAAVAAVRTLDPDAVHRRISAVAGHAMRLPAAEARYGIVGFCWGGAVAFEHATRAPALGASVVYYGTSPETARLARVEAPVLGLYGGDDARVNATVPAADSAMAALGKRFEHRIFEGAGHGFLRAQEGREGANLAATRAAWPLTLRWLREGLGR